MNIIKIWALFLLPLTLSAQQTKPLTTKINFKISGYTEGAVVKLLGAYDDQNYLADTARLAADGKVSFVKTDGFKEGLYFILTPDKANLNGLDKTQNCVSLIARTVRSTVRRPCLTIGKIGGTVSILRKVVW